VESHHVKIKPHENFLKIKDLGSRYGTFIKV